ncbi:MAG TPA: hypothetical protein VK633_07565, partial [Verrucomicrobiae bacterium]|nr:hypothetical protein [Verrucomicrobiae bacterium]
ASNTDMKIGVVFLYLFASALVGAQEASPQLFVEIMPRVAVARKDGIAKLKKSIWPSADGTWVPSNEQVTGGLDYLNTPQGRTEIAAAARHGTDMMPSLERSAENRFQVYGLIINKKRCILFDAVPLAIPIERRRPTLWLEQSLSRSSADGGSAFWWFLFDCDDQRVVASWRRPDS